MVHENFRFQPWYREIKRLLDGGVIGDRLNSLAFHCRPGDGWGDDAYLARQPYFREMPRFLLYETGIHFIDTFRYLAGEVTAVFAHLRRLNPVIAGEDRGLLLLEHETGCTSLWEADRCHESTAADPRYTFGRLLVEGSDGSLRLHDDGSLTIQPLGEAERIHEYEHSTAGFGGDCVFMTQRHFVECLLAADEFETSGPRYLKNLEILDAAYSADQQRRWVSIP